VKAHPRSAFGASPSRGRHQRPGKAGSAVARDFHASRVLFGLLAALGLQAAAQAQPQPQPLFGERELAVPAAPGSVAPWRPTVVAPADPAEGGTLHTPPTGPTLVDWYAAQGRPTVALFFDRRLERLPPGWDGTARLRFGWERSDGRGVETEQLTVGVERKARTPSVRERAPVVLLIEGALQRELQSSRIKLVDPTVAERALAARSRGGDTEFESLRGAASYLLEVELVPVADTVSLVGSFKALRSSDIVATVRQPVEHDLRSPADIDALAKVFVRRLLAVPAEGR